MALSKENILKAEDLKREFVEVPEWGQDGDGVWIGTMSGLERSQFVEESFVQDGKKVKMVMKNYEARLLAKTLQDDNGNRLFSDSEMELLAKKNGAVINRLAMISQRINGLGAQEQEDMTKN